MIRAADLRDLGVVHTPLVSLPAVAPDGVRLLAKREWHQPTGSIKDRVAAAMIADAERRGELTTGARLLEPSSGNTGIALARLATIRGYEMTVVVPDNVSEERIRLLEAFGATVVESPGERGSNGAVVVAEKLASDGEHVMLHQYENRANPLAHSLTTGPEILSDVDGPIHAIVASLGTGGTLMGVADAVRPAHPNVRIVAAEPPVGDQISGLRSMADGYVPPIFDPGRLDGRILIRTGPALAMMRRLLREEGLFVGPSAGAAVEAAVRVGNRLERGSTVVVILADAGWMYLSTGVFEDQAPDLGGLTLW